MNENLNATKNILVNITKNTFEGFEVITSISPKCIEYENVINEKYQNNWFVTEIILDAVSEI